MRDEDWGYMSESEKLGRISAAEDRNQRDMEAVQRLKEGQNVKTPDGWTGFISEKVPSKGKVYVESWNHGGYYAASRVTPDDTSLTGEL